MPLTAEELIFADTNGDGEVNSFDAAWVLKYAAGLPTVENYVYVSAPVKTNYAAKSTYIAYRDDLGTGNNSFYLSYPDTNDWADVEHTKLTDGVVGDPSTYDSSIPAQAGVTVQCVGTNKYFVFKFDLGRHYGDIKSLEFLNVRHGTPNGNNRGFAVMLVLYSDDGINWTRANGTLTGTQVAGAVEITSKKVEGETNIEHFNYVYTFDQALKAKYIKIFLVPGEGDYSAGINPGYILQLEEIEINN